MEMKMGLRMISSNTYELIGGDKKIGIEIDGSKGFDGYLRGLEIEMKGGIIGIGSIYEGDFSIIIKITNQLKGNTIRIIDIIKIEIII